MGGFGFRLLAVVTAVFFMASLVCAQFTLGNLTQQLEFTFEFNIDDITDNLTVNPNIYIVYGSDMDLIERGILDMLRSGAVDFGSKVEVQSVSGPANTQNVTVGVSNVTVHYLDDSDESLRVLEENKGAVIFLGDADHNLIAKRFMENASRWEDTSMSYGQIKLREVEGVGGNFTMLSHPRSRNTLVHEAAKTSPLRKYIPVEYVPIVAAGSGLAMMWLWNIFQTVFEFKALKFGRKKRKTREKHRMIGPIKVEETLAVLGASFILGLSITFTFFGFTSVFASKLLLNWGLCLFAAVSHEVSHRLVGRMFNIHIEYHFWWTGSAITLLTGYLGHPFSIQGFLIDKVDGKVAKWKYGLTKLAAPALSWAIMMVFAWLNYNNPTEIYQLIFTTASLWATAEILPFRNLDGRDVRKWSKLVWLVSFIVIFGSFIAVNFLM